jgi:hypothetical protein
VLPLADDRPAHPLAVLAHELALSAPGRRRACDADRGRRGRLRGAAARRRGAESSRRRGIGAAGRLRRPAGGGRRAAGARRARVARVDRMPVAAGDRGPHRSGRARLRAPGTPVRAVSSRQLRRRARGGCDEVPHSVRAADRRSGPHLVHDGAELRVRRRVPRLGHAAGRARPRRAVGGVPRGDVEGEDPRAAVQPAGGGEPFASDLAAGRHDHEHLDGPVVRARGVRGPAVRAAHEPPPRRRVTAHAQEPARGHGDRRAEPLRDADRCRPGDRGGGRVGAARRDDPRGRHVQRAAAPAPADRAALVQERRAVARRCAGDGGRAAVRADGQGPAAPAAAGGSRRRDRLRGRHVLLSGAPHALSRLRPAHRAGPARRPRLPVGVGQDDPDEAAAALRRRAGGPHPDRRPRHCGGPPKASCDGR